MEARMTNPVYVLPSAMEGVGGLLQAVNEGDLTHELQELVALRASQINGCGAGVHGHVHNLVRAGESGERIAAVAAWRDAPFFTAAERAALDLAEHITRLPDRTAPPVPDELWNEVAAHFDERQLAALILVISLDNLFDRISTAVQEPAGLTPV